MKKNNTNFNFVKIDNGIPQDKDTTPVEFNFQNEKTLEIISKHDFGSCNHDELADIEPESVQEDGTETYYLGQVVDVLQLLSSPPTQSQIENNRRLYFIKSPMGSGKTHIITEMTNYFNDIKVPTAQLMVYKKNIEDIIESTKTVKYLKVFSEKAIKNRRDDIRYYSHVQTYTKRFFDVFAEGLIEEKLEAAPVGGYDSEGFVENYFKDKVIFVDECDFMINMLAAFTSAFTKTESRNPIWQNKHELLKDAAKLFYERIANTAKAVVFLSATSTKAFEELLPEDTVFVDPRDSMLDHQILKSISIASVVYIPFFEWTLDRSTLTDRIIGDILEYNNPDKVLHFVPNVKQRTIDHYNNHDMAVIAPPHKLNETAKGSVNLTEEAKAGIESYNNSKATDPAMVNMTNGRTLIIMKIDDFGTNSDTPLNDLFTSLTDDVVENVEVVIVNGSNCRAANILGEYDNIVVITDAPWGSEIIQVLGRFRNARIYAFILNRHVSNTTYNPRRYAINKTDNSIRESEGTNTRKQSDMQRRSPTWWKRNSADIHLYWADMARPLDNIVSESKRIEKLIGQIEDFDFTLANSMTPFTIGVDLSYCEKEFNPTTIPFRDKKVSKVAQFLIENRGMTQKLIIDKWNKTMSHLPTPSPTTITKYNKHIKAIEKSLLKNPGATPTDIREECLYWHDVKLMIGEALFIKNLLNRKEEQAQE